MDPNDDEDAGKVEEMEEGNLEYQLVDGEGATEGHGHLEEGARRDEARASMHGHDGENNHKGDQRV